MAEDPETDGLIFVGTDLGVYVSGNGGQHWESLCHTLPTAPVVDLAIQDRDGAHSPELALAQRRNFTVKEKKAESVLEADRRQSDYTGPD